MAVNSGSVVFLVPNIGETNDLTVAQHPFLGALPAVMAGKGTPDGDRAPFTVVPKGSLYIQLDAADDAVFLFGKVDDADADNDWNSVSMT